MRSESHIKLVEMNKISKKREKWREWWQQQHFHPLKLSRFVCVCACVFYDPIWLPPKYLYACVWVSVCIKFQFNVARVEINNIHFQKIYGLLFIENIALKKHWSTYRETTKRKRDWVSEERNLQKTRRKCSNAKDGDAKKWKKNHYTNEKQQEPKLVRFFSFNWSKMT